MTYRMASHSSSDDASRYRDAKEFEQWKQRDPIQRFQKYLKRRGLWNETFEKDITTDFKNELAAAVKKVEASGKPPIESMFEDVYMNQTPQLREQQQELLSLEGPEAEPMGEFPL